MNAYVRVIDSGTLNGSLADLEFYEDSSIIGNFEICSPDYCKYNIFYNGFRAMGKL